MKLDKFLKTTTKQVLKDSNWKFLNIEEWKPFNFVSYYRDKFKLKFGYDSYEFINELNFKNERQKYFIYNKIKRFTKRYGKELLKEFIKWSINTGKTSSADITLRGILDIPNNYFQEFINLQMKKETKAWSNFKRWKK